MPLIKRPKIKDIVERDGKVWGVLSTGDWVRMRCGVLPGLSMCDSCKNLILKKKENIMLWPHEFALKYLGMNKFNLEQESSSPKSLIFHWNRRAQKAIYGKVF